MSTNQNLSDKKYNQRLNLLLIPLRTVSSISISNELFCIKYQTWCILLNVIYKQNLYPEEFINTLNEFFKFSFAPSSQKITKLHLKICENFFKIIANTNLLSKYTPVSKYDIMHDSIMTTDIFISFHEKIISYVDEASYLLINCVENKNEARQLNELLWEALFDLCENSIKKGDSDKIVAEIHQLVTRNLDVSIYKLKKIFFN